MNADGADERRIASVIPVLRGGIAPKILICGAK
jgi:hypothetical protein